MKKKTMKIVNGRIVMLHDKGIYFDGFSDDFLDSRDKIILRYLDKLDEVEKEKIKN